MKKIIPGVVLALLSVVSHAQTITHANFILNRANDNFRSIELELDSQFVVGINGDGDLLFIETLDGEELFDEDCDRLGIPVKYYDKYDIHDLPGRIKSIGGITITYNNVFDPFAVKGTLKQIGDLSIAYYDGFNIHDPKGKVKSVGEVAIEYYNAFDRKEDFGKIKSIRGNNEYLTVLSSSRSRYPRHIANRPGGSF